MATNTEFIDRSNPDYYLDPSQTLSLQRLVDDAAYVPQALSPSQFAILDTILHHLLPPYANPTHLAAHLDATLANGPREDLRFTALPPLLFDYQLALDELDTIAHLRTGFAFADLTPEIQDAMLSLIASQHLNTKKLDLRLWLDGLHSIATATLISYSD